MKYEQKTLRTSQISGGVCWQTIDRSLKPHVYRPQRHSRILWTQMKITANCLQRMSPDLHLFTMTEIWSTINNQEKQIKWHMDLQCGLCCYAHRVSSREPCIQHLGESTNESTSLCLDRCAPLTRCSASSPKQLSLYDGKNFSSSWCQSLVKK